MLWYLMGYCVYNGINFNFCYSPKMVSLELVCEATILLLLLHGDLDFLSMETLCDTLVDL